MMVVGGLFRVVASSRVFLLAITTVFVSVSGADSAADYENRYSSAADFCPAELLACEEDATCFGCIAVQETSGTELEECASAIASSLDSSDVCANIRRGICCVDELSEYDCMGNDVFVELGECVSFESGCSADDISCSGNMSLGATRGRAEGSSSSSSRMGSKSSSRSSSSNIAGSSVDTTFAFFVYDYDDGFDDADADDNHDNEDEDADEDGDIAVSLSTDVCRAEEVACDRAAACSSCVNVMQSTEVQQCESAAAGSGYISDICADAGLTLRCIEELFEYDCMGDDVFVEYITCALLDSGCSADDISRGEHVALGATYDGAGEGSSTAGLWVVVTVAFAFVVFAAGVSVGVMMSIKFVPESRSFSRII